MIRIRKSVAALWRSRAGASAVELALLCPLLLLFLVGLFDFGIAISKKMQLNNAAAVGAQYAVLDDRNPDGIRQAIASATRLSEGLNISTGRICECLDGRVVTCSSPESCGVAARRRQFVEVSVSAAIPTLFDYPGVDNPLSLTGVSRIQVE